MTCLNNNPKTPADIFDMGEMMSFSSILTDEERFQLDRLTVKKVKVTKDCNGCPVYSFSLYLDKVLVADISHGKYGEAPNVNYSPKGEAMMLAFIHKGKWDTRLPELMYNEKERNSCTLVLTSDLANAPITMWEMNKARAKIIKKTKSALIFGSLSSHKIISWGKLTLSEVASKKGGKESLVENLTDIQKNAKEGEVLFNSVTQIEELGLSDFVSSPYYE